MNVARLYLVTAFCLLLPVQGESQEPAGVGTPPAQSLSETIARIDSTLTEAASDGMNGVVHVRVGDEVLLHRAYGWRDRERADPMTKEVGFDIGSLVKPLTAVAVLKAEEEGFLSTADPLGEHFPDAPADKRGITIEQLLRHRSGFQDYIGDDYETISRSEAIQRILTAPLEHPPGTERAYSNSGYTLLAIILEVATGQSYEAYVREEVLEPAGVPEIGYVLPVWSEEDLAVGYDSEGERWGTPVDQPWLEDGVSWTFRGAGGMLGTAEKVARWYRTLIKGQILGVEALEHYLEFGADPSPTGGGRLIAHAGGNGVFNTLQVSWIEADVHFTLFTSTARPLNAETVVEVDDIFAIARSAGQGSSP